MYGVIVKDFSTLAKQVLTDGSTLMIAGGTDILPIFAFALILVILAARIVASRHAGVFKSFRAVKTATNNFAPDRIFERKRIPALKPCPSCAEQLPLSAILCNACDYNFLAARPGRGQKLLPPPEAMIHGEEQRVASAGL